MTAIWRMGFRLRYVQAGMSLDADVNAMLTNLNATFYVTLGFQWCRIEELTSDEERTRFSKWHDRLDQFIHSDGEMIARRIGAITPQ